MGETAHASHMLCRNPASHVLCCKQAVWRGDTAIAVAQPRGGWQVDLAASTPTKLQISWRVGGVRGGACDQLNSRCLLPLGPARCVRSFAEHVLWPCASQALSVESTFARVEVRARTHRDRASVPVPLSQVTELRAGSGAGAGGRCGQARARGCAGAGEGACGKATPWSAARGVWPALFAGRRASTRRTAMATEVALCSESEFASAFQLSDRGHSVAPALAACCV